VVIFHRLATAEFVRARRRYGRIGPALEQRFVDAVAAAVLRIGIDPNAGVAHTGMIRWLRTRRFPYLLFFEPSADGDRFVYAVAHQRQKPGYWMRRRLLP